jgi:hypothetical protein
MNVEQKTTAVILILSIIGFVTKNLYLLGIAEIIALVMIIVIIRSNKLNNNF